ncbi:MAG: hypothetical protein AAF414_00635 [Pseudomonadota bacterium]
MLWLRYADYDFSKHGLTNQGVFPTWERLENGGTLGKNGFLLDSGKNSRIRLLAPPLPLDGLQIDLVFRLSFPLTENRTLLFAPGMIHLVADNRRRQIVLYVRTQDDGWHHAALVNTPDLAEKERRLRVLIGAGASILLGLEGGPSARGRTPTGAPASLVKPEFVVAGNPDVPGVSEEPFVPGDFGAIRTLKIDFGFDEKQSLISRLSTAPLPKDEASLLRSSLFDMADNIRGATEPSIGFGKTSGKKTSKSQAGGYRGKTWAAMSDFLISEKGSRFWHDFLTGRADKKSIADAGKALAGAIDPDDRSDAAALVRGWHKMLDGDKEAAAIAKTVPEIVGLLRHIDRGLTDLAGKGGKS